MTVAPAIVGQPGFLPGPGGDRFILSFSPRAAPVGRLILLQPFAEEANKSRRMLSECARAAAGSGWQVLLGDVFGTGDSAGDFADANWDDWLADVVRFCDAVSGDKPLVLCGVRFGALLAAGALQRGLTADAVVLINPVISGKMALTQFLRLGAAGELGADASARIDTRGLRERLDRGETVEIAGYGLSPALAAGMEASEFDLFGGASRLGWIEIGSVAGGDLPPAAARTINRLRAKGADIQTEALVGPAFWQTQEIETVAGLPAALVSMLGRLTSGAAA